MIIMRKYFVLLLFIQLFLSLSVAQNKDIQALIDSIEKEYIVDSRTQIYRINLSEREGQIFLEGIISNDLAYNELRSGISERFPQLKFAVRLLPDREKLGNEVWGVVYNSVGTMRAQPSHAAEIVSQALLGTPVRIFDAKGDWKLIQTPDLYIGWINGSIQPMDDAVHRKYLSLPKLIVTAVATQSHKNPDVDSQPVSDLVAGDMLVFSEKRSDFYSVSYPDGRNAWVAATDVLPVSDWLENIRLTGESIVAIARKFVGVPYLWGGTSAKSVDCSGFVKSVYFMHGIILARDASQQARYGKLVDTAGDFSKTEPGDLVFFGRRGDEQNPTESVVHVGIYIGNNRFIHASDYVHISSFDPNDPLYDAYNTNRYLRTKRILGEINTEGVEEILHNEFYR